MDVVFVLVQLAIKLFMIVLQDGYDQVRFKKGANRLLFLFVIFEVLLLNRDFRNTVS